VSNLNDVFNRQQLPFACFAVCEIDYCGICVIRVIICIFAYKGSQKSPYEFKYLHHALITYYARPNIVETQLTLTFMMG
jgi:hypothetical protein